MAYRSSNLADAAAQLFSSIIGRGCYLALQVFLARSLGPREFGLYAIGWTVTGLVGTIAPIGMPQTVLRYSVAGREALHTAPIVIAALAGLVSFIVLLATAGPIANFLFDEPGSAPAILALAPSVPLLCIFGVLAAALRSSHANLASAAVGAMVFVLYLAIAMLGFAAGGRTPMMAGYTYTVAIALTLIPTVWLLHRLPSCATIPGLRPLLGFGIVTMLIHSANVLNLWADRVVVGVMADVQAVGVYQVASQLAMVALVLRSAVGSVFEARVPKTARVGAAAPDVTREFIAASRILLHASAPGLICLALTARFWTDALFGPDYRPAAIPLAVLAVGQLGQSLVGPSVTALHMTGEERTAMRFTIASGLLNILGNVALIPLWGLAGSAAATGIVNVAAGSVCLWRLRVTGRLRHYFSSISDILLASIISAAVAFLMTYWLGIQTYIAAICMLAAAYITYALVIALCCRVEDEAFELGRALLRRRLHLHHDTRD